jgi:pimeloyl-ACP methyl ester carboxylesterase
MPLLAPIALLVLPYTLPAPTGPYPVGTATFHLTDSSRQDPLSEDPPRHRDLMVEVRYPARARTGAPVRYLSASLLSAMQRERYLDLTQDQIEPWGELLANAVEDAAPAEKPSRLPLLLFSHGLGMSRAHYTTLIEELASHGYLVAAIDHPYEGLTVLPDGRVLSNSGDKRGPKTVPARIEEMARDFRFVLDTLMDRKSVAGRFAGRIDRKRLGVFGHSLGGAAALEACREGGPFAACADLDGDAWGKVEQEGVGRPFLVLLNEPGEGHRASAEMRKARDDGWAAIIAKRKTPAAVAKISGTFHLSFSDIPFLVPKELLQKHGATIDAARGREIIGRALRAFFGTHFKTRDRATLESLAAEFPQITLNPSP